MVYTIEDELRRRWDMWEALLRNGGSIGVQSELLRKIGIYGGYSRLWMDKARTAKATPSGIGATVAMKHTGRYHSSDLHGDHIRYHYPETCRPKGRDLSEIEATKEAGRLGLPVFVIIHSGNDRLRDVYMGWVDDWDDGKGIFLVSFGSQPQGNRL